MSILEPRVLLAATGDEEGFDEAAAAVAESDGASADPASSEESHGEHGGDYGDGYDDGGDGYDGDEYVGHDYVGHDYGSGEGDYYGEEYAGGYPDEEGNGGYGEDCHGEELNPPAGVDVVPYWMLGNTPDDPATLGGRVLGP